MKTCFVFGSNLQGRHGAGAALTAKTSWGAEQGVGVGPTGNAYALPTKRTPYETLPLDQIQLHVEEFLKHAANHPDVRFQVTAIGTGLAGYKHEQIAPMFEHAPKNCLLPTEWNIIFGRL